MIDLDHKIKKLDGSDWKDFEQDGVGLDGKPKYKETPPLNIRRVCASALMESYPSDQKIESLIKAQRGWLAMKIFNHPESTIELTVDDIKLCKDLIAKRYNPLIIAQAWEVLDPESKG